MLQGSENWFVKRPRESDGSSIGQLRNSKSHCENDSNSRDGKRAKKLNYGFGQSGLSSADHIQAVSHSGISFGSSSGDKNFCAFCQSSKVSEVSSMHSSDIMIPFVIVIDVKM